MSVQLSGQAKIVNRGYEVAMDGKHLTQDGRWSVSWYEAGIWHELADAELALAKALKDTSADMD